MAETFTPTPGSLTASDGLKLRTQHWAPSGPPKALVMMTHGHGEHSSRYLHVGAAFAAAGYAAAAYDLRGHGRSGGPRGHTPSYAQLLNDAQLVFDWAGRALPAPKAFLYGHSLGGQITLAFALDRKPQVAGVAVSAPWLRLKFVPPAWKVRLGLTLSRVWPTFTLSSGLDKSQPMAHDTTWLSSFPELELTHTKISARLGAAALAQGAAVLAQAAEFRHPLLVLHGGDDQIMDPDGSRAFVAAAGSADKTLKVYPDLYHEVHNEHAEHRAAVLADLITWFDAH
ncbi:MAG: lysophospholipase [Anaerolineales bacterium]|nr:lysophospholipase [Anaerolineales bacterium]